MSKKPGGPLNLDDFDPLAAMGGAPAKPVKEVQQKSRNANVLTPPPGVGGGRIPSQQQKQQHQQQLTKLHDKRFGASMQRSGGGRAPTNSLFGMMLQKKPMSATSAAPAGAGSTRSDATLSSNSATVTTTQTPAAGGGAVQQQLQTQNAVKSTAPAEEQDGAKNEEVDMHATNTVAQMLAQLRGGGSDTNGANNDSAGGNLLQESTVEWHSGSLPVCRALPPQTGMNWAFAPQGDVEWWDAPFLNAPSYTLGIKPECLATKAIDHDDNATAVTGTASSPPPSGGSTSPLTSSSSLLSGPNVLPTVQKAVFLAKTPQEIKREKRARKRERQAEHERDVRLGLVKEVQRTTKHSILAAFKGKNGDTLAANADLAPSAMEENMRQERQARVNAHYERNHIAHHLAIPHQRLVAIQKTLRHVRTDPQIAVFRLLNVGCYDSGLCKRNLDKIKINAKDHYIRGVIVWIARRHVIAAFVGGRNPIRKMRHLISSRIQWPAAAVAAPTSSGTAPEQDAAPNAMVKHVVVDNPWTSSLVDVVEERAVARSEELFAKVIELKKKQRGLAEKAENGSGAKSGKEKEKQQEYEVKLSKARSVLYSDFLFSSRRVVLEQQEDGDEPGGVKTTPVTVAGGESVKVEECDTAYAAMRIFDKAGLGHAWDCVVQEPTS